MQRDFLRNIGPLTSGFLKISLDINDLRQMDNCVKHLLGVPDIARLKDMYEGDAFRKSFHMRTSCEIAFEKFIGIRRIDWDKKKSDKQYIPEFLVAGKKVEIVSAQYGNYPIITGDQEKFLIITLFREPKDVLFCGLQVKENIMKNLRPVGAISGRSNSVKGYFSNFDELLHFNNFQELENLIYSAV